MIHIAIPTITPRLAQCARQAIRWTTPEPHQVIIGEGSTHGENLDRAFATLPDDAEYFMTMDDDAAPLKVGWLTWLRSFLTPQYDCVSFGLNAVVGSLYRVASVRATRSRFSESINPGDAIREKLPHRMIHRVWDAPWWLKNCEAYRDDDGDLVFAHLGGGTIGHTWRLGGHLYPRIPASVWPLMVRRHLRTTTACRSCGSRAHRALCVECELQ